MAISVGAKAPDFNLPGVDGQNYSLSGFADKQAVWKENYHGALGRGAPTPKKSYQ